MPGRLNFVVSSSELEAEHHNVIRVPDMEFNQPDDVEFWIIGGAKLVETSWKNIDEIHLTKVYDHYACDTFIDLLYVEHNYVRTYSEIFPDHVYEIWKRK